MFSSGFSAGEMRTLLGEALAIFVACCVACGLTLELLILDSGFRIWL